MHCIVHCTVHCTVHCIVHYTVHYMVHYIVHYIVHYVVDPQVLVLWDKWMARKLAGEAPQPAQVGARPWIESTSTRACSWVDLCMCV